MSIFLTGTGVPCPHCEGRGVDGKIMARVERLSLSNLEGAFGERSEYMHRTIFYCGTCQGLFMEPPSATFDAKDLERRTIAFFDGPKSTHLDSNIVPLTAAQRAAMGRVVGATKSAQEITKP